MEIYKINNVNDFLKEGRSNACEILGLKGTIENYIRDFFAPHLNIQLNMDLKMMVQGEDKAFCFDQMAFIEPLAKLLDIDTSLVKPEDLAEYICVRLENRMTELKGITREEELIVKFPHIYGIYQTKKDHIEKSVSLEQSCKMIKPSRQAEEVKAKKLQEFGIKRAEHISNLVEAYTFNFAGFLYTYYTELLNIMMHIGYLSTAISQTIMPITQIESLDEEKIDASIKSVKTEQKERGLK